MNTHEAETVLVEIEDLFPKWQSTDTIRKLWRKQIGYLSHHPGQVVHAVEQHRMKSKFHDPSWDAIRGILSNIPVGGREQVRPDATQCERSPEWCENFDRKRQTTRDTIAAMDKGVKQGLANRAADRLDAAGCNAYAKSVRALSDGDEFGGSCVAALEEQMRIER